MKEFLSPAELATVLGCSESSVRRWCDSGRLRMRRTSGGHRRIARSDALRFVRRSGLNVAHPELLAAELATETSRDHDDVLLALEAGDADRLEFTINTLYLNGMTVSQICDGPLRNAMADLGARWPEDNRAILLEHRATMLCLRALSQLRRHFTPIHAQAPRAIGAAPPDDPYLLPSWMVSMVLAELGFRDVNLGPNTPLEVLTNAASEHDAQVVWLSLSRTDVNRAARDALKKFITRMKRDGLTLILGGKGIRAYHLHDRQDLLVFENLTEMAGYARSLIASGQRKRPGAMPRSSEDVHSD